MAIRDALQNYAASAGRKYRGVRRGIVTGATTLTGFAPFVPEHLLSSPQDLVTPDPALAREFYEGRYMLAGRVVDTLGRSPFALSVEAQTELVDWAAELHRFEWLRHFTNSSNQIATGHAIALVKEWIDLSGGQDREIAWDVENASRRLISWLQNSVTLLSVRDRDFHYMLMRSLGAHVRYLKRHGANANEGMPQLLSVIALTYAWATFALSGNSLAFAGNRLNNELEKQILPEGIHVSRNPVANVELLVLLLPLKETLVAAGKEIPESLVPSIERLLQGLQFFRMGDGSIARFNGAGFVEASVLATVHRYAQKHHNTSINASLGGYERLQIEDSIVLSDVGAPPRGELSNSAHAGCLSFEFSAGADCIVVNAGRHAYPKSGMPAVWRSTAAHSTAVFYNTSSCKFENAGSGNGLIDGQVFGAPLKAEAERSENDHGITLSSHHMGYVREFGARHQRILTLDKSGSRLRGNDWFSGPDKGDLYYTTKDLVSIRFHLHPNVTAAGQEDGSILLGTRSGQAWRFECSKVKPEIEDSVFFAGVSGTTKTSQITLGFKACKIAEIDWSFTRL